MSLHLRLHVVSAKKNQSTVLNSDLESFKTFPKSSVTSAGLSKVLG